MATPEFSFITKWTMVKQIGQRDDVFLFRKLLELGRRAPKIFRRLIACGLNTQTLPKAKLKVSLFPKNTNPLVWRRSVFF